MTTRTFEELNKFKTLKERFDYLCLKGTVGESTFGFDRYINQTFYKSRIWTRARDSVIVRDNGCDLGLFGYEIRGSIFVHHMNPISINDILLRNGDIFNPNYLVCVSYNTHLAIHYGDAGLLPQIPIERRPNDTIPWR